MFDDILKNYEDKLIRAKELIVDFPTNSVQRNKLVGKMACYRSFISDIKTLQTNNCFVATGNEFGVNVNSMSDLINKESAIELFNKEQKEAEATVIFEINNGVISIFKQDVIF